MSDELRERLARLLNDRVGVVVEVMFEDWDWMQANQPGQVAEMRNLADEILALVNGGGHTAEQMKVASDTVTVGRGVLLEMLRQLLCHQTISTCDGGPSYWQLTDLANEVESGDRNALTARDWSTEEPS